MRPKASKNKGRGENSAKMGRFETAEGSWRIIGYLQRLCSQLHPLLSTSTSEIPEFHWKIFALVFTIAERHSTACCYNLIAIASVKSTELVPLSLDAASPLLLTSPSPFNAPHPLVNTAQRASLSSNSLATPGPVSTLVLMPVSRLYLGA